MKEKPKVCMTKSKFSLLFNGNNYFKCKYDDEVLNIHKEKIWCIFIMFFIINESLLLLLPIHSTLNESSCLFKCLLQAIVFAFLTSVDHYQPAIPCILIMICTVAYSFSNFSNNTPIHDK